MQRINESIASSYKQLSKSHRLLADFISANLEKVAFSNSFELAALSGVSQSTVMRFSKALGYPGFTEMSQAMENELKYRLTALQKFELLGDSSADADILEAVAAADAINIKKNTSSDAMDGIRNLCVRISLAPRVYVYGQGMASFAAGYLAAYLEKIAGNVCALNLTAMDPLTAASGMGEGDLLICLSFPVHNEITRALISHAHSRDAAVAVISEGLDSAIAGNAHISLACEFGEFGVNGTMAPVISLCGSIITILAHTNESCVSKLKRHKDSGEVSELLAEW